MGLVEIEGLYFFVFEKVEEIKLLDSLKTIGNNAFCTNFLLKWSHFVSFFKMLAMIYIRSLTVFTSSYFRWFL